MRCRINRLSAIDRVTGEPIRRYEHDHPGSLIHVDVTKFGNIPDGGGWRFVGRVQGERNREATATRLQRQNVLLTDDRGWWACRDLFSDERSSYRDALDRQYRPGAPENWHESFISEYATLHPWEDFAETFAHYLHITGTL